jgi:Tripartite tricarboxylate transporter TctB family
MTLRSDHVAGAAFVVFGAALFALSGDLPFGSFASPGAGMMPKLLLALMILFGIALIAGAAKSQIFAEIDWGDRNHALLVVVISAIAIALYQTLGFILTMSLLVFTLLMVVERKNVLPAAAYAIGLTAIAWWVFGTALKSPLETGILGF